MLFLEEIPIRSTLLTWGTIGILNVKLKKALAQWGLDSFSHECLLGTLSGGEKTKVFLAALDMNKPDFILLDEPSNHLDTASRRKLYDMIRQSKATILIVSHDRTLLQLMDKTLELNEKGIEVFGGNFEFYQRQKKQKVYALQARLNEQVKALKQAQQKAGDMASQRAGQEFRGRSSGLSNSIPRIIAGGLKNRAERSTAKMLDAHKEKVAALEQDIKSLQLQIRQYEPLKIDIGTSALPQGKLLIDVASINFGYDGKPLWSDLSFQIRSGDRVQIEGDNGAGKTTLLKIITRQLKPFSGACFSSEFSYLYLDQNYTMIDPDLTIYRQVQAYNRGRLEEDELKALLLNAQFDEEMFDRKSAGLSGGEQMKLALCCSIVSNPAPDVLLLDEPTNNLDVQSLEVLTAAVKNFEGTLLVISHDGYFIKEIGISQRIHLT